MYYLNFLSSEWAFSWSCNSFPKVVNLFVHKTYIGLSSAAFHTKKTSENLCLFAISFVTNSVLACGQPFFPVHFICNSY